MPSARLAAFLAASLAGSASAAPTWTLEAETGPNSGFVAYGVLIARNDVNGPTGQIIADAVNSFESPFPLGDEILDFGGALHLVAADVGEDSSVAAEMRMHSTVDGSGLAAVTARLHADGAVMRTGAAPSRLSMDPNNRAVFAVRVTDAAPDRPVHVSIAWRYDAALAAPAFTGVDASVIAQARMGREGDAFLPTTFLHLSGGEANLPLTSEGGLTLTLAPSDLAGSIRFHLITQCFAAFEAQAGVAGPLEAGEFESDLALTVSLRQFCPGDTNGDDVVNFADLNTIVGSFNAVGPITKKD